MYFTAWYMGEQISLSFFVFYEKTKDFWSITHFHPIYKLVIRYPCRGENVMLLGVCAQFQLAPQSSTHVGCGCGCVCPRGRFRNLAFANQRYHFPLCLLRRDSRPTKRLVGAVVRDAFLSTSGILRLCCLGYCLYRSIPEYNVIM